MRLNLSLDSLDDYRLFLRLKGLPRTRVVGRGLEIPDEYAAQVGLRPPAPPPPLPWETPPWMFDYQAGCTRLAIRRRKFAVFMDPGLGKTLVFLEFARYVAAAHPGRPVLIVSVLADVRQTVAEARRFYGQYPVEQLAARDLPRWLEAGSGVAITNYEAITRALPSGRLAGLVLNESSTLKSHYGRWGSRLIAMGRGVPWKLALTGTPAPNDRVEYANHAVFLDAFPNVNAFLARFFVNRGKTDNRWEMKAHARPAFFRALAEWSVFVVDPSVYGWRDNVHALPPIRVHVHDVGLTAEQEAALAEVTAKNGVVKRAVLGQLAKGRHRGREVPTHKTAFVRDLVGSWPDSTIVWCLYNAEQDAVAAALPGCANIDGRTPAAERERLVAEFQAGRRKVLVSKPKILGFGLNLQVARRQVFSGLQDSYESYFQAVKRSNRYGSTEPLDVHIPVTRLERPMVDNVLRKAARVREDTLEQQRLFRLHGWHAEVARDAS